MLNGSGLNKVNHRCDFFFSIGVYLFRITFCCQWPLTINTWKPKVGLHECTQIASLNTDKKSNVLKNKRQNFFFTFRGVKNGEEPRVPNILWMSNFYTCMGLKIVHVRVDACVCMYCLCVSTCVSTWFPEFKNTHHDGECSLGRTGNSKAKIFPFQKGAWHKPGDKETSKLLPVQNHC